MNQMLDCDMLRRLFPKSAIWGNAALWSKTEETVEVEVISGACLMAKREVLDKVEPFDSRYFMYSEDVDLCFRIKKAGWRNIFVKRAVAVHHGGQSSTKVAEGDFSSIMLRQARYIYMSRWHGRLYAVAYRTSVVIAALCRIAVLLACFPVTVIKDQLGVRHAITKWYRCLRWGIGLERWSTGLSKRPQEVQSKVMSIS
jgi:hypothetical protein